MSVKIITKDNFDLEVLKESKTVLLDFWASWCGPCRMVSPIIDEIATERADLKVGKVNVDEQPELAAKFGVMSIPTLIVMKDGKGRQPDGRRTSQAPNSLLDPVKEMQATQKRRPAPPGRRFV